MKLTFSMDKRLGRIPKHKDDNYYAKLETCSIDLCPAESKEAMPMAALAHYTTGLDRGHAWSIYTYMSEKDFFEQYPNTHYKTNRNSLAITGVCCYLPSEIDSHEEAQPEDTIERILALMDTEKYCNYAYLLATSKSHIDRVKISLRFILRFDFEYNMSGFGETFIRTHKNNINAVYAQLTKDLNPPKVKPIKLDTSCNMPTRWLQPSKGLIRLREGKGFTFDSKLRPPPPPPRIRVASEEKDLLEILAIMNDEETDLDLHSYLDYLPYMCIFRSNQIQFEDGIDELYKRIYTDYHKATTRARTQYESTNFEKDPDDWNILLLIGMLQKKPMSNKSKYCLLQLERKYKLRSFENGKQK